VADSRPWQDQVARALTTEEGLERVIRLTPQERKGIRRAGAVFRWRVTVNGLPHSWLPYEGIHTLLGVLPAVIHPAPVDIALVGLGSGETAWAASCRPETRSIRVYEIAAAQPRLLRGVSVVAPFPGLVELLSDPRLTIEVADGRRALARLVA
jgi:hypothetical protein